MRIYDRPSIVTAAAVIMFVLGGLSALGGLLLLADAPGRGLFLLVFAAVYVGLGVGVLGGSPGARAATIVFMCVGMGLHGVWLSSLM